MISTSNRHLFHQSIFYYCLIAIVVTLPFSIPINSICIIALTFNWILEGKFALKLHKLLNNKIAMVSIGLYILHLIGMLYTSNQYDGRYDLEKKLTILLFPLVLATTEQLPLEKIHTILKSFVIACVAALFICLLNALYIYIIVHNTEVFFYHQLGSFLGINAIYLALYLTFSVFIIVYFLMIRQKKRMTIKLFLLLFLLTGIVLLSSKTLIISIFIFSNILAAKLLVKKINKQAGIILIIVANILGGLLIANIPYTRNRFQDAINFEKSVLNQTSYVYNTPFTGISLRLVFWKFSVEILNKEQAWIWGVGTGDSQELLDRSYKEHNLYQGAVGTEDRGYLGYDIHNQFFAFILALGIIGLLWFFICLLLPAYSAYQQNNYLYLSFIFLFVISSTTESLLCSQKGIIFYAFFNAIFAFHFLHQNQHDTFQAK